MELQGAGPGLSAAPRRRILTLAMLGMVFAFNNVDRNMFALLLPQMRREIVLSDVMIGLLTGPAFAVIYSVAAIPIAWLSDRVGRKSIIALGLGCWSLVTVATGLATRVGHLVVARLALGVAEATNLSPGSAMIADMFPPRTRAVAFSVVSASGSAGVLIAFPMIGAITQEHGWRAAFWLMGGLGLLASACAWLVMREPARPAGPRRVETGTLKFSQALSIAVRSWPFMLMVLAGVMISIAYSAMTAWLPTFMLRVNGLNARETGAYIGMYRGGFGILAALAGGVLVTVLARRDGRWLAWFPGGLCLLLLPCDLLLLMSPTAAGWQIGLALDTLFLTAAIPSTFALVVALVDPRMRATGTSLYMLAFNLVGQSVGPFAVGVLNQMLQPAIGLTAIRYSLLLAPASLLIAAVCLLRLAGHFGSTGQVHQPLDEGVASPA